MSNLMLTHVMLGCSDPVRSRAFYDATMTALGHQASGSPAHSPRFFYGAFGKGAVLGVGKPVNGEPASYANGGTIGFAARDKQAVDGWHAAGLAHGGSCHGPPGPRPNTPGNSYGAYLRDPDCAFCQLPA
jgi:catechol 2,3-dioxygenase-like lactoylglutathione lyase family enzyme